MHTYGLVDELVPASPALDRVDAVRLLVRRFFAGHGPAGERDLLKWTTLTLTEIRSALAELGDTLATMEVDGATLWFDPACVVDDRPGATGVPAAGVRRGVPELPDAERAACSPGHLRGDAPHHFAESGGGVVVLDRHDIGWWKRKETGRTGMTVSVWPASGLDHEGRELVAAEAARLAAFFGRESRLEVAERR